ncbi:MAG: alcohol dehydrogenase catalytic domain-containing protein [Abditibacteriales bacterium]|nr:alcohol dehydrogenase catalytic domain-containing protein [Abditibacteriales bacterium]MDW8365233.1 alcohol dehydrogenase catalytic domain-containing protein [Abditibacteriales bacterium]
MQAAVFDGQLRVVRDYPVPVPQADEALIRVSLAGICGTDLAILRGYADFRGVLGHEFVGVVEACADKRWMGKRVVGEINIGCGNCHRCTMGWREHCAQRKVLGIRGKDGAFAEYLTLPVKNLHLVPPNLSDEEAVFTEPLAAAFNIPECINITPNDRVFVLGDGRLGMLAAQVLALTGCTVTLVGRHPSKLELAQRLGLVTASASDLKQDAADIVVECTGSAQGFADALAWVRPQGTIVVKSTYHGEMPQLTSQVVVDEIYIVGSRCGPFPPALRALRQGRVKVTPLIEATYPLPDFPQAMEHAGRRGVFKVLVRP